jgi:uncharacterized membrane protein SpoIIM required for sporulation
MVLENLLTAQKAKKHPFFLFFTSFLITIISIITAYYTFPNNSSILAISFVTIALMPIIHNMLTQEEKEIARNKNPFSIISANFDVIHVYSWIFIGILAAYTFFGIILPEKHVNCENKKTIKDEIDCVLPEKEEVFSEQYRVYTGITGKATGKAIGEKECFNQNTKSFEACYEMIFKNNMWVMIMALIFSLMWGAGAITLLGWNASVIGTFIAMEINSKSIEAGIARALGYIPHGLPEIFAYFIAAIAGGIISAAVSKNRFKPHEIKNVLIDTAILTILATITLAIGAGIETTTIFGYENMTLLGTLIFITIYMALYILAIKSEKQTTKA